MEQDDSGKAAPPVGLIWSRLERAAHGPRPRLTHAQIAQAAIRVGDTEGLAEVSMRRVAAELGVGAMSLYRYVLSKDDLLDLMLDAAYGELALPDPVAGDWRAELKAWAYRMRDLLRRHPWLPAVLSGRPPLGPNYLRHFEASLALVTPLGLDITGMMCVIGTVGAYVLGVATYATAEAEADRRTGLSEAEKHAAAAPYLDRYLASGQYPNLARFFHEAPDLDPDRGFEFGLERVLDGLSLFLERAKEH